MARDPGSGARIWAGWVAKLQKEEGGIFDIGGNLAILGTDEEGLTAAAEAYATRAPYQWKMPGDKLAQLGDGVHRPFPRSGDPGAAQAPGSGGVGGLSPDITWDAAYTEAPDETAHGEYMKLMAAAGLAFDYVHLKYLAEGDQRITRSEREVGGTVQYRIERARPVLPK